MSGQLENLLDETDMLINDIKFAVNDISLSKVLPQSPHVCFLNLETKEKDMFTIRLSREGFKVISHAFDLDEDCSAKYPTAYETIYALLDNVSPSYVSLFGQKLAEKLEALQKSEVEDGEASGE